MKTASELSGLLSRIDGSGYKAYKKIEGDWSLAPFVLHVDHVQGDPYAAPSRLRLSLDSKEAMFPGWTTSTRTRTVSCEDFVARIAGEEASRRSRRMGTGGSGQIRVDAGGQEILHRTAVRMKETSIELRLSVGLPAKGRRVMGKAATGLLLEDVFEVGKRSLFFERIPSEDLVNHLSTAEDHEYLQAVLDDMGLVAFIADGSILPRESGVSQRPLNRKLAVPFESPQRLRKVVDLPHAGTVSGMGIPEGVTLIAGGGFHGKSTLLEALSLGVYPHVVGDGRERVASRPDTVKVCAEDGRRVERVNIAAFIGDLPGGIDTTRFSTDNASGSTSQASYIVESIEMGCGVFLIDEDISATNFLIRDARMQQLIPKEKEPITPYIDMVRNLFERHHISTLLVLGGAGDYFDVADTVIAMDEFVPYDATGEAQRIAREIRSPRQAEGEPRYLDIGPRRPDPASFDPRRGGKSVIKPRGLKTVQYGRGDIDLSALMQLIDSSQTRSICEYLRLVPEKLGQQGSLRLAVESIASGISRSGLECISLYPDQHPGDLAWVRTFEVAAAINRLRSLRVRD